MPAGKVPDGVCGTEDGSAEAGLLGTVLGAADCTGSLEGVAAGACPTGSNTHC